MTTDYKNALARETAKTVERERGRMIITSAGGLCVCLRPFPLRDRMRCTASALSDQTESAFERSTHSSSVNPGIMQMKSTALNRNPHDVIRVLCVQRRQLREHCVHQMHAGLPGPGRHSPTNAV